MSDHPIDLLAATIADRAKSADTEASWTAKLLAKGPEVCARKFGEEAVETIVAALSEDKLELTKEAADVIYHLLVLLLAKGVHVEDVYGELSRRTGQSGIAEKASR